MAKPKNWRGFDRLQRQLAAIPKEHAAEMQRALGKAAIELTLAIRAATPVKSGALRDSITWQFGNQTRVKYSQGFGAKYADHGLAVRITAGNARVRYPHIVEYGAAPHKVGGQFAGAQHPGTRPQPYFWPTIRARKKAIKARLTRASRKAIRTAAKKG